MKHLYALTFAVILLVLAHSVDAKGGAGGTPAPSCSDDEFACGTWGPEPCPESGRQTRTCTKKFDCPGVSTPSPETTRTCTFIPPCSEDTYTCGGWAPEPCPSSGRQTRACTKTFDCQYADTASPSTERGCTPPTPVPEPVPEPEPRPIVKPEPVEDLREEEPAPTPEPAKEPTQEASPAAVPTDQGPPPKPACDEDIWECDLWGACEQDGRERRTCNKTFECDTVETPSPETERICPGLQCGQKSDFRERVACRLNLSAAERQEESNILYFPEYCRAEEDDAAKQACIDLYWQWEPCWRLGAGPERSACGREKIGFGNFAEDVKVCSAKPEAERSECFPVIVDKVRNMVLFSLYELEFKAEELLAQGRIGQDDVVDLITHVENAKIDIGRAGSHSEWKLIILRARESWKTFTESVQ